MPSIPQDTVYRPDMAINEIADFIADPVAAADFPESRLRFRNDRAAAEIGLSNLSDSEWVQHFARFQPLADNLPSPLALRYHGHQFRNYNPDIGDGRGFLFAQMRDQRGRLIDLGTKGSGTTPYSRFGDGRLTLKGAVREILATEMLEALGVETSKTFSMIETGEALHRGDEPSPTRSAVLVRMNHGHIRIGSFQRLAALRDGESMMRLTAYALKHYYAEEAGEDAPARLLTLVAQRTARMAASYMAAGFVHGVLNTDNINVSGESFDYGPWRWTPHFDGDFTAAYFDEAGLYAFGRQAEAIHWNVVQLAIALNLISEQDPLIDAINAFTPAYQHAIADRMLWRLGVASRGAARDAILVKTIEQALSVYDVTIDRFFFDWAGGSHRALGTADGVYDRAHFGPFRAAIADYTAAYASLHDYFRDDAPCSMYIDEVEAIWAPIAASDDWTLLENKVSAIRRMGAALASRSE
jgi:serine/tyrosine/threonine adenylyltransferase